MSQFKDAYGILALAAATKKITQEKETKRGCFFWQIGKNILRYSKFQIKG